MIQFDSINASDLSDLECAATDIINLLNIFTEWFQYSHKAATEKREATYAELSELWADTPRYDSLLTSIYLYLSDLQKALKEASDAQSEAYKDALKAEREGDHEG